MARLTTGRVQGTATGVSRGTAERTISPQTDRSPGMWRHCIRVLAAFLVLLGTAAGDEPGWLTGKAFQQILKEPLSVTWSQVDLRTVSRRLEENRKVALLVDRRLDPSATLDFRADDLPLDELFARLAQVRGGVARVVGNTVYLGPGNEVSDGLARRLDFPAPESLGLALGRGA